MTEFLKLRTAEEAWEIFRASFAPIVGTEPCPVIDALDRVLAQDATAPHDLPTFVRSTVDGYAVQAADTHGASAGLPAYLDVVAEVPMGARATFVLEPGQAALMHTGGNVPEGADAVVMLEYTHRAGEPLSADSLTAQDDAWQPFARRGLPPAGERRELHPDRRGCAGGRAGAAGRPHAASPGHRRAARRGHHRGGGGASGRVWGS